MKASIKFELRKDRVDKEGKRRLGLRYTAHCKTTLISLNISLSPNQWNSKSNMIKNGCPLAYEYNKIISEIQQRAQQLVLDHFFHPLTVKEFKKKLFVAPKKDLKEENFYEFILPEIELEKPFKSKGTISNYFKLINTMKLWKPELTFEEIDLDFIKHFHKHELDVGNELSTIYKKCIISVNPVTNRLMHCPVDKVYIPREICQYELSPGEIAKLKNGEKIPAEGLISPKTGKEFNSELQINAVTRRVEFVYDKSGLFKGESIGGIPLSPKEINDLNMGRTILVENMHFRDGSSGDRFVTWDIEKGYPMYTLYNPQSPEGDRELIIPKEIRGVAIPPEDRDELRNGGYIWVADMKGRDGIYSGFIRLDMETGRQRYSKDPNNWEQAAKPQIQDEYMGRRLKPSEKANLQDGKAVYLDGLKGSSGTFSQWALYNSKTGHVVFTDEHPDKKNKQSQDQTPQDIDKANKQSFQNPTQAPPAPSKKAGMHR